MKRLADGLAAIALALAPLHLFLMTSTADMDLWGHLRIGRLIWETGDVPRADPFSFTAFGAPWVSHEWLFQLGAFLLFEAGGAAALQLARFAAGAAILALIAASVVPRADRRSAGLAALALACVTLAPGFNVRPQLATYAGCALIAAVFQLARRGSGPCRAWLPRLPWILLPWSWLHGGFLAGAAAFVLILAGEALDGSRAVDRRRLAAHLALALLATALNPYGPELWRRLYETLTMAELGRYLEEWQPAWAPAAAPYRPLYAAYALALAGAFAVTPRRGRDAASWLLALAFLAASLRSVRHLPLLGIFAAAPLAGGLDAWLTRDPKPARKPLRGFLPVYAAVMAAVIAAILYADLALLPRLGLSFTGLAVRTEAPGVAAGPVYPKGAVEFIRAHELGGAVLNDFNAGNYLIWHLYPRARVYIDPRAEHVYGPAVFEEYARWSLAAPGWEDILHRRRPDLILASTAKPIVPRLLERTDWQLLYSDPDYVLLAPAGRHPALARACAKGSCPSPRAPLPWPFP